MEPHEQSFFVPLTDAPVGFGPGGISTAVDQRQAKRRGAKADLVARQPVMLQRKPPRRREFRRGAVVKTLAGGQASAPKICAYCGARSI